MILKEPSDQDLIELIIEDQDYLGIVYKKCKDSCIRFMRNYSKGSNITSNDLEDIYQDTILIFYEKIVAGSFVLTASIQTYMNSVCRFQLLNRFKLIGLTVNDVDKYMFDNSDPKMKFDGNINDVLEPIEHENEGLFKALERALDAIKNSGGQCYELLTMFWHQRKSINELTAHFGYTNDGNTKHQKSRCQKRLKTMAYNYLNE